MRTKEDSLEYCVSERLLELETDKRKCLKGIVETMVTENGDPLEVEVLWIIGHAHLIEFPEFEP